MRSAGNARAGSPAGTPAGSNEPSACAAAVDEPREARSRRLPSRDELEPEDVPRLLCAVTALELETVLVSLRESLSQWARPEDAPRLRTYPSSASDLDSFAEPEDDIGLRPMQPHG
jgi:hypothetical protein